MRRGALLTAVAGLLLAVAGAAPAALERKAPPVVIGVVLPPTSDPLFGAIQKGVDASAAANGFRPRYASTRRSATSEASAIQTMIRAKVDALLVVPATRGPDLAASIDAAVAAGIETATAGFDVTGSRRVFFYGPNPAAEGRAQAQRLLLALHTQKRKGVVEYAITSCFPNAVVQRGRRVGFEAALRANPYKKEFTVKRVGFYGTSTVPSTNRVAIAHAYAKLPGLDAVYAECEPDTVNWGVLLRQKQNHSVLVAGHEWSPAIFTLVSQGWVAWSLAPSPYDMGYGASRLLFQFESQGTALPKGTIGSKSVFVTKTNIAQVKAGPDYLP
jgi:ABC-type sugar transport system substrate-binding protein